MRREADRRDRHVELAMILHGMTTKAEHLLARQFLLFDLEAHHFGVLVPARDVVHRDGQAMALRVRALDGGEPVVWLDGLDIPIVALHDAQFAERGARRAGHRGDESHRQQEEKDARQPRQQLIRDVGPGQRIGP